MLNAHRAPEIMTPDQAADYLQVDRETVYRYIRSGKLDASRLGRSYRIPRRNVELLLLATRTRPYVTLREYTDEQIEEFDRRSPVDLRILLAGILAVVIGVGVATSGFGLIGDDSAEVPATTAETSSSAEDELEVAVLNGTSPAEGQPGVDGVANRAEQIVKDAGFATGEIGDAGSFPASVIMFEDGSKSDAKELAAALEDALGETEIQAYESDVQDLAGNAPLSLIVGIDDQGI